MRLPADRDRWLALALLLGVLALAYLLLLHPWWTVPMAEAQARIEALRERDLRVRAQLQQAPALATRLQEVRATQARGAGFLEEPTAELATASLVQRLESVVQEASPGNTACAITNRAPVPAAGREDDYRRVTVQARLRCGHAELAAVLHALESGTPRLFVDNLNLVAETRVFLGGSSGGQGGMDASFELHGFLRPTPASDGGVVDAP
ncbi:type II secretion system protein GspM [Luteimonas pelagia]